MWGFSSICCPACHTNIHWLGCKNGWYYHISYFSVKETITVILLGVAVARRNDRWIVNTAARSVCLHAITQDPSSKKFQLLLSFYLWVSLISPLPTHSESSMWYLLYPSFPTSFPLCASCPSSCISVFLFLFLHPTFLLFIDLILIFYLTPPALWAFSLQKATTIIETEKSHLGCKFFFSPPHSRLSSQTILQKQFHTSQ